MPNNLRQSRSKKHQVLSDGRTVWVNSGTTGACLARFSPVGIDIHHDIGHKSDSECLSCTHGHTTKEHWERFVREMKKFYDVAVTEKHRPKWLEN